MLIPIPSNAPSSGFRGRVGRIGGTQRETHKSSWALPDVVGEGFLPGAEVGEAGGAVGGVVEDGIRGAAGPRREGRGRNRLELGRQARPLEDFLRKLVPGALAGVGHVVEAV